MQRQGCLEQAGRLRTIQAWFVLLGIVCLASLIGHLCILSLVHATVVYTDVVHMGIQGCLVVVPKN